MTADARNGLLLFTGAPDICDGVCNSNVVDGLGDRAVAVPAGLFCHTAICLRNPQRIGKASGSKIERMPEPIARLDDVLSHRRMGCVAVVARSHGVMTTSVPGREVLTHDVAVGASLWIVSQIRGALCIAESKESQTESRAQECNTSSRNPARRHLSSRPYAQSSTERASPPATATPYHSHQSCPADG